MKKEFVLTLIAFLLLAVPVSANQGHKDNDKDDVIISIEPIMSPSVSPTITPSITVTTTPSVTCDKDDNWKNHGEYVSCIAKEHVGKDEVIDAAHSDIGKKKHTTSITPSISPSISPNLTPSVSPTATSEASIAPSVSPTLTQLTALPEKKIKQLITTLEQLINFLTHFI